MAKSVKISAFVWWVAKHSEQIQASKKQVRELNVVVYNCAPIIQGSWAGLQVHS